MFHDRPPRCAYILRAYLVRDWCFRFMQRKKKRCSVHKHLHVFVEGVMSYSRYLCLFAQHLLVSNTYCVVFLFDFSSSCVRYVVSFSGLSIVDCLFGIL